MLAILLFVISWTPYLSLLIYSWVLPIHEQRGNLGFGIVLPPGSKFWLTPLEPLTLIAPHLRTKISCLKGTRLIHLPSKISEFFRKIAPRRSWEITLSDLPPIFWDHPNEFSCTLLKGHFYPPPWKKSMIMYSSSNPIKEACTRSVSHLIQKSQAAKNRCPFLFESSLNRAVCSDPVDYVESVR